MPSGQEVSFAVVSVYLDFLILVKMRMDAMIYVKT